MGEPARDLRILESATALDDIYFLLSRLRFGPITDEYALQRHLADCLSKTYPCEREYVLPEGRLDIYVPSKRVAIEVKVDGSLADLTRQIHRYSESDEVGAILVVTTRSAHRMAAAQRMNGKPVAVLHLLQGAF